MFRAFIISLVLAASLGCSHMQPANHGYDVDLTPDHNGETWK
jgi:hypothetical protein